MSILKIGFGALVITCLLFAQDRPRATEKSTEAHDFLSAAPVKSSDETTTPSEFSDVFRNVVVPPGKTISLDSTLDYSSSNTVAVTIQCNVCGLAETSLGASGLVLLARWMVPNAELYVATENKSATGFPYWDAGGAIFSVYGSQFRLTLQNRGTEAIKIQQLTMFRRSQ